MRGLGVRPVNVTPRVTLAGLAVALAAAGAVGCSRYDDRPAEWGYISPAIFQPNCATTSCHGPAAAVSGLDFSTPANGYASLTELCAFVVFPPDGSIPVPSNCHYTSYNGTIDCFEPRPLVTAFDPAGSRLVNTLRAQNAPRMPPDRPLPEADIELVERWILNGASQFPGGPSPDPGFCTRDAGTVDATSDAKRSDAGSGPKHSDAASDGPRDGQGQGSKS
jgi:hypothetical protein